KRYMNPFLLKAERKQQGLSQAQVAEALGVSARTLRRWEQGLVVPYPYYRERLCVLFGKTAEELGLPLDDEDGTADLAQHIAQEPLLTDPTIPQALERNSLLGRDGLLMQVKHRLLQGHSLALMALSGLPGIGETALAAALATDQVVQSHFCDGILWAGLGSQPDILGILSRWGKLLGVAPSQVENLNSREAWGQALRAAIGSRRLLLIIDDALTTEDVLPLRVGGTECVYLLTTRLAEVAFTLQEAMVVPQLKDTSAIALLAQFVPDLVAQDFEGAQALVRAAHGLPLTLTLMGNYLASQDFPKQSQPLQAALAQFHATEERLRVGILSAAEQRRASLAETVPSSLLTSITLCDQQLSPQAHATLGTLATVFRPKPHSFSEEAALAVSQQPLEILDELWDVGLIESCGSGRYTLHQTIANYACALDEVPAGQQSVSLVGDDQAREQETASSADYPSFFRSPWDIHRQMKSLPISISFKRFSWSPLLILSIILLAAASIIAVLPAFMAQPSHKLPSGEDNYGPPQYSITIQSTDSSLQDVIPHLQDAFNSVYPQLVNRFAFDPATAPKNVILTFSSDLPYPSVTNGTTIILNTDWIRQHPTDMGVLTHQLTYLVLHYPASTSVWFTTGMADYARSVYGPADDDDWSLPDSVQPQDSYTQGFEVTARFLVWLEQHTTLHIVDQLNHALQTGQPLSGTFQRLTHQTVDGFWREYQAHPDIVLTPEQFYRTVTSRKPLYQSSLFVQWSQPHSYTQVPAQGFYVSNFAVQTNMTIIQGDGGGFIFRAGDYEAYRFRVSSNGTYNLVDSTQTLAKGFSSVIKMGLNQTNLLTIIAQRHRIYIYINRQLITEVVDHTLNYGMIGALAFDFTHAADVRFDNMQVF
ncbi:MAG TPA: NB-ARC domain-containing protein, partial [Ktedonobacteraceae bacterium]|nr:NB-ARC domain-containing protein [Ktedonobacteraceae bacterium]